MNTNIIVLSILLTTNTVYKYPYEFIRTSRPDFFLDSAGYVLDRNTNASTRKSITICTETTRLSVNGAEHEVSREVWRTERAERKVTLWVLDDAEAETRMWDLHTNDISQMTNSITIDFGTTWTNIYIRPLVLTNSVVEEGR